MLHHVTYHNSNSTEWVTFIHGAGGNSNIWFKQVRAFQQHFNVLLVDLRGHGESKSVFKQVMKRYSFKTVTQDVLQVLDHLKIQKSHLVGISMGTIIAREMAELAPTRVSSLIMGGAVMKLDLRSQFLMKAGNALKSVLPYMVLYKLFAFIILPKRKHKASRNVFIREAQKLYQKEFLRWFRLTSELNPILKFFRTKEISIPTLYVMGDEDYLFLPSVQKIAEKHRSAVLEVLPDCGHIVNIEKWQLFNEKTISFIANITQNFNPLANEKRLQKKPF